MIYTYHQASHVLSPPSFKNFFPERIYFDTFASIWFPGLITRDEKGNRCNSGAIPVAVKPNHHAHDEQLGYIATVVQATTGRKSKFG